MIVLLNPNTSVLPSSEKASACCGVKILLPKSPSMVRNNFPVKKSQIRILSGVTDARVFPSEEKENIFVVKSCPRKIGDSPGLFVLNIWVPPNPGTPNQLPSGLNAIELEKYILPTPHLAIGTNPLTFVPKIGTGVNVGVMVGVIVGVDVNVIVAVGVKDGVEVIDGVGMAD